MLEDSQHNDTPGEPTDEDTSAESSSDPVVGTNPSVPDDLDDTTPNDFVDAVRDLVAKDPTAAGDHVGALLTIAKNNADPLRDQAGEALNAIGLLRPSELEVWTVNLVEAAESSDDEIAFLGLRALAQLAATHPQAASKGLDAGFRHLDAEDTAIRQAALAIVAEVGADDPTAVRSADRHIAAALRDSQAPIRQAGAMAAGRLLAVDPTAFPRTAPALIEVLSDDNKEVREYAHVALAAFAQKHPTNVPEPQRAVQALLAVSDKEIGLREGATDAAARELLDLVIDSS